VGLQVPYSLVKRDAERELLPMARSLGLGVTAWSPLAGGVLSGKYTPAEGPSGASRLNRTDISPRELAVATAVQAVADEIGATPPQVAIAWTTARWPGIHPILGARRVDQLVEN